MKSTILNQLLVAFLATLLLNSCNEHKDNSHSTEKDATTKKASMPTPTNVVTYIDDFESFRDAIHKQDVAKMKTFFKFPVFADTAQIWEAIYDNMDQGKRQEITPHTFTGEDLEKNHRYLFNDGFVKSLLNVDAEQLYKHGEFTTPKTIIQDRGVHMIANYDRKTSSLQLSLMFSGWKDENGEDMSEGESATIYFFKITKTNHLVFDKILFAG
ncbi:hypothetical protein [Pedobacter agri]|uniref:Lipoprotein n=1 Tax=Pedobacter agri TaxID=454586 RepID=A0A9X3DCG2_9SPHI|nr:hypothetical protein [Pedobacter agri]MCX3264864.1 hypothetical protein [Pedobacter agri]